MAVLRPAPAMAADGTTDAGRALAAGPAARLGDDDVPAQFLHLDDLAHAVVVAVTAAPRRRLQRRPRRVGARGSVRALVGQGQPVPAAGPPRRGGRPACAGGSSAVRSRPGCARTRRRRGSSPTTGCGRRAGRRRSPTSRPSSRAPRPGGGRCSPRSASRSCRSAQPECSALPRWRRPRCSCNGPSPSPPRSLTAGSRGSADRRRRCGWRRGAGRGLRRGRRRPALGRRRRCARCRHHGRGRRRRGSPRLVPRSPESTSRPAGCSPASRGGRDVAVVVVDHLVEQVDGTSQFALVVAVGADARPGRRPRRTRGRCRAAARRSPAADSRLVRIADHRHRRRRRRAPTVTTSPGAGVAVHAGGRR